MRPLRGVQLCILLLVLTGLAGYWATRRGEAPPGTPRERATEGRVSEPPVELPPRPAPQAPAAPAPQPDPWIELNERGVEAMRARDFRAAVDAFERCAEAVPDEPVYRANLARALASLALVAREEERSLAEALVHLRRAVQLAVDDEQLAALLERWTREAEVEEPFSSFDSDYFQLSFDGERTELLHASQRFLDRLESAYADLREWFVFDPVLEGRPPFPVRLYRREEFDALTGLGHWAAGAFDGTIRLPLDDDAVGRERWNETLRHELVHAFVHEVGGPRVPGWLNEGLAQWLEESRAARVAGARSRLRAAELAPLEDLRSSLARGSDPAAIRRSYDQSLAFVDYLAQNYGESVLLEMIRAAARRDETPEAAFRRTTGVDLESTAGDFAASL